MDLKADGKRAKASKFGGGGDRGKRKSAEKRACLPRVDKKDLSRG